MNIPVSIPLYILTSIVKNLLLLSVMSYAAYVRVCAYSHERKDGDQSIATSSLYSLLSFLKMPLFIFSHSLFKILPWARMHGTLRTELTT